MHEDDEILHETFQPIDWCPICNYTFVKGTGVKQRGEYLCSPACAKEYELQVLERERRRQKKIWI